VRSAEAQAQVDAAREEPDTADVYDRAAGKTNVNVFIYADQDGFVDHVNGRWADRMLILTGAELQAYRALQAAAYTAHAAQQTMAATGATLREAIQGLCAVIAPGKTEP
jgi:hypothetical protein